MLFRSHELVKLDPTNTDYVFNLVKAQLKLNKQHSAAFELDEYEKAGGKKNEQYFTLRGNIHRQLQEYSEAKTHYEKALQLNKDSRPQKEYVDALLGLSKVAHAENKTDERDSYLERALTSSPHHLKSWQWKAALAMAEIGRAHV